MKTVKLSEITTINPKFIKSSDAFPETKISFVPMASVSETFGLIVKEEKRALLEVFTGFTYFQTNDVLIAKITPCFENGKIALAKIEEKYGFGSTEFHVIRAKLKFLDPNYLFYFLRQNYIRKEGQKRMTGSVGQQRVPKTYFENLQIPLPPLPEQRRIAAILGQADELRQLRREAMNKASQLLSSFFYEMFGNPVTNEKGWQTKTTREIGQVITGNTPPRDIPEYYGDFIEWVKSDNLDSFSGYVLPSKEKLSEEGTKKGRLVPYGSTLITCIAGSHESIGKAAFANRELSFNQQINAVVPFKDVDPHFLFVNLKLSKPAIQSLSSKGMKGIVNKTQLENIKLIVPPKSMQKNFSNITFEIIESLINQENSYNQFDNLFQSLLSQAFTGELTATWREKHADELVKAAQERDELLKKTKKGLISTKPVKTDPRKYFLDELKLSENQQKVYEAAISEVKYFTPESLAEKDESLNITSVKRTLHLLEAVGLLMKVSIPSNPMGKITYIPAYRALWPKDIL